MSRYIKYDTALRYIKDAGMRIGGVWGIEATAHFEHEPTIEIIRCRECKHWHEKDELTYCDRIDYGYGYKPNDFCSYGERKEQ